MNFSAKKLSILGLVLVTASAVTAAILPSNKNKTEARLDHGGSLTQVGTNDGGAVWSCTTSDDNDNLCNVTDGTFTTANGDDNSYDGQLNQTIGNTTT